MSVTFQNAPLVEIIAEIKWNGGAVPMPTKGEVIGGVLGPNAAHEQFYDKFKAVASTLGYRSSERLQPKGYPAMEGQPVFRVQKENELPPTSLFHLGPGLFSAHALPPYTSWHDFRSIVRNGVEGALSARTQDSEEKITTCTLRYIDAFKNELKPTDDFRAFLKDYFGLTINLPDSIEEATSGNIIKPALQLAFTQADGANVQMVFTEALVQTDQAYVVDMSIVYSHELEPNVDVIMKRFEESRNTIHGIFVNMTKPLHNLMKPSAS